MDLPEFVERIRDDAAFAEAVRSDPDRMFADSGLDADGQRRVRRILAGIGSVAEFFEP